MAVLLRDTSGERVRVEIELNPDLRIELSAPSGRQPVSGPDPDQPPPSEDRLPHRLIDKYVRSAIRRAMTEQMSDGHWYAEVLILPGVWAEGSTKDEAMAQLAEVVKGWVLLKIEDRDRDIPVLETLDLNWL
jgi:predicted RNase H-like HicB family nuclease